MFKIQNLFVLHDSMYLTYYTDEILNNQSYFFIDGKLRGNLLKNRVSIDVGKR
jgi:hypothetical protein